MAYHGKDSIYGRNTKFLTLVLRPFFILQFKKESETKMLKTELKVEARGSPNIKVLPKTEQEMFFETIFKRITELYNEKERN